MTQLPRPLRSLQTGHWFKLICGASYHHLPEIRNLALVYSLAGADCIDVAADPAVIAAAREGMFVARRVGELVKAAPMNELPWLMVSLNDGEDPHFRKAEFEPTQCPLDCPRPCVAICPAQAIAFDAPDSDFSGVLVDRCYGCGRCLPVCPIQQITTRSQTTTPAAIAPLLRAGEVQAIEIHTQVGRLTQFQHLWQQISPYQECLQLLAISCPDGEGLVDYLWSLWRSIAPLECPLIWQTDGRPMSGDIGDGATRQTVKLGQKVLAAGLPGYVQLAGGTNNHTVAKLKTMGLLSPYPLDADVTTSKLAERYIAGVAYGSFARSLLTPIQDAVEKQIPTYYLEKDSQLLHEAVGLATALVCQIKPTAWVTSPVLTSMVH